MNAKRKYNYFYILWKSLWYRGFYRIQLLQKIEFVLTTQFIKNLDSDFLKNVISETQKYRKEKLFMKELKILVKCVAKYLKEEIEEATKIKKNSQC